MSSKKQLRAVKDINQNEPTTKNIRIFPIFLRTFFSKPARKILFQYLRTVIKDFFWLQFSVKLGLKKIPIINIDHELDNRVPFTPERVSIYLDFVAFWIRPLGYIGKQFGTEAQLKYTSKFLALVDRCYKDAAEVYRFRMTTTRRPKYYKGQFLTIHAFDPHYLCVPSLHVIIVVLAYTFYRRAFRELGMEKNEAETLNKELFEGAIEITETVLYIKQHSVNCIPAALYAMTRIFPEEVNPSEIMRFTQNLFADAQDIPAIDVVEIQEHIASLYEILFLEGCHDSDWTTPLQRWLKTYSKAVFIHG